MDPTLFLLGGISGGIAVALGAFGAHALKAHLTPDMLATFETGVRYQMYHALALLAASFAITQLHAANHPAGAGLARIAGWLFVAGTLLFSGSLYLLALTGRRWLGAITPFGGLAFLAGWLCLVLSALRGK